MRRPLAHLCAFLCAITLTLATSRACAHAVRTGSLRVDEVAVDRALVRWSSPIVGGGGASPELPSGCVASPVDVGITTLACPGGLAGRTIAVRGLGPIVSEATVVVHTHDGRALSHVLTADEPAWTLPRAASLESVARSYVGAGVRHIAGGADHLLFLVLLVLVLRRPRAVLVAETAFTVSHSLAYAATALGLVRLRPAPVEACIALSIVLLALEVRAEASARPVAHGAAAAFVFGLVHGLGFAGGMREAGLPDAHAAVALLGFGAGVEIGQVAFLAVVLGVVAFASRARAFPRIAVGAALVIGSIATAWLVDRLSCCVAVVA